MNTYLRVSEIMSIFPIAAGPDTSLGDVARRMRERGISSVLVTDGPRLLGIVTERDMVSSIADGRHPATTKVSDLMTPAPLTLEPDSDIVYAAQLMSSRGIRHLPVVQENLVVGMVSIRDIVRWGLMALAWDDVSEEARQAFEALGSTVRAGRDAGR